jgi:hypothetical protein
MRRVFPTLILTALLFLSACQSDSAPTPDAVLSLPGLPPTPVDPGVVAPEATPNLAVLPHLSSYLERVQTALEQPIPILTLDAGLDEAQQQAQQIAVNDSRLQQYTRDRLTGAPLRSEIFGVYPLRDSDVVPETSACSEHPCYRVEIYNFAQNFYLAAVVDMETHAVIDVLGYQNTQPDIPQHLTDIAIEIATQSPEVIEALGHQPENDDALMANTKTSLNNTRCDRSRHLCVAPTFVIGKQALWAIVDLTDGVLVGARWTLVGSTNALTEKELENQAIMRRYCQENTALERDGWQLNYILTSSDGLRISEVSFQDKPLIESAKLVDWHVNYSSSEGFGYSDAVGCPMFSQAAVIAVQPPVVEDLIVAGETVGFALVQDFWSELWPLPCNYRYEQRYEFYDDGRFRPIVTSIGRGCGNDGTYRPVTRVAMAGNYTFAEWDGAAWKDWAVEGWRLASDVPANAEDYAFRLSDDDANGFYVVPSTGQFGDGGRGDDAYVYVTLHHPNQDEGDSDMPTIGPCCNLDYQQGPEKFINTEPEAIADSSLVLWYVAQLKNDDTAGDAYCWAEATLQNGLYKPVQYPCPSGPLFVPVSLETE